MIVSNDKDAIRGWKDPWVGGAVIICSLVYRYLEQEETHADVMDRKPCATQSSWTFTVVSE